MTSRSTAPLRVSKGSESAILVAMSMPSRKLLEQAMELPREERAELAAELLASLEPLDPRDDREWIAEIERRARAALAGSPSLSWEEARAEVESRLRRG